jgi:hypothetical protein
VLWEGPRAAAPTPLRTLVASKRSYRNRPPRSCGTRDSSVPTRVISVSGRAPAKPTLARQLSFVGRQLTPYPLIG